MEVTVSVLSCPCARKLPEDVPTDGGFLRDKSAAASYTKKGTRCIIIIIQNILAVFLYHYATVLYCRCTPHSDKVHLAEVAMAPATEGTLLL